MVRVIRSSPPGNSDTVAGDAVVHALASPITSMENSSTTEPVLRTTICVVTVEPGSTSTVDGVNSALAAMAATYGMVPHS